jgi:hypothetical protein
MQLQQRKVYHPKHIQTTAVSGSPFVPIINKIWYKLQDSTHRQIQQILHNISHCLNWVQKGVKNPLLMALIFPIRSLHNLNHVLVFTQITLAF